MKTKHDCANWLVLIRAPYWRILNFGNSKICHGTSEESEEQPDKKLDVESSKNYFLSVMDTLPEGNYLLQARTGVKSFTSEKTYTFYNGDNANAQDKPQEKISGLSSEEREELKQLREYQRQQEYKKLFEEAQKPLLDKIKKLEDKQNKSPDTFDKIMGIFGLISNANKNNQSHAIANVPTEESQNDDSTESQFANNLKDISKVLGGDDKLTETIENLANFAKNNPIQFNTLANNLPKT